MGNAPEPLVFAHFPDRLHAVVWRNWGLVRPELLAQVLSATPDQVGRMAASMGLPPAGSVPPELARRAYITILRRNWHLLPYSQLLDLIGMTESELEIALREDDFLFVKLGNLKPHCERVIYHEPDAAAQSRAAWIRSVVEARFGAAIHAPIEPRFAFEEQLASVPEDLAVRPYPRDDGPRFLYSYFGGFGDPLAAGAAQPYPDGLLARLAETGVNGIWLHTVLRQLAPGNGLFPDSAEGSAARLANLAQLVQRARRYGINVYLYINEPRAMPSSFFTDRPDLAGVPEGAYRALCTSEPRVRAWLADSLAQVFEAVPGLGGVFTITASENLTHCASHGRAADCPRCRDRNPAQIIAEVNATIEAGVHRSSPNARVIVWDWGWPEDAANSIIDALPRDVWLMSVSEWSLPIERGGVRTQVGEYSLSAVGPGPRARAHWAEARRRGLPTVAKVQLNNTWELSAIPWLPVLDLVATHSANLAREDVKGMMLGWSLGGYPSPNLQVADQFARDPNATVDGVLDSIAAQRYGNDQVARARAAWHAFSTAFQEYPFHIQVAYRAPQQFGPSNLLFAEPTGYAATMIGFPYDDLDGWRGPYPPEVFAAQFEKVANGWNDGLAALASIPGLVAEADLRLARAAGLHFASVAHQARFILARQQADRDQMLACLRNEADAARALYELACADSRIGFEASNHYYYVPLDLVEKVLNCADLERRLVGQSPRVPVFQRSPWPGG